MKRTASKILVGLPHKLEGNAGSELYVSNVPRWIVVAAHHACGPGPAQAQLWQRGNADTLTCIPRNMQAFNNLLMGMYCRATKECMKSLQRVHGIQSTSWIY